MQLGSVSVGDGSPVLAVTTYYVAAKRPNVLHDHEAKRADVTFREATDEEVRTMRVCACRRT